MHPQERDLINTLFDRLTAMAGQGRDGEAATLIQERARAFPDALYTLVQAAALQEVALGQAQTRIAELERQVKEAQMQGGQAGAAGFLGSGLNPWAGAGNGGHDGRPRTSVPSVPPVPASVPMTAPVSAPPQQPVAGPSMPWGQQQGGGGFLRGVAGTALGVAGGALLAQGISSLFSGHSGFGTGAMAAEPRVTENVTVNNYYDGDSGRDAPSNDGAWSDSGSDWGDDGQNGDDNVSF